MIIIIDRPVITRPIRWGQHGKIHARHHDTGTYGRKKPLHAIQQRPHRDRPSSVQGSASTTAGFCPNTPNGSRHALRLSLAVSGSYFRWLNYWLGALSRDFLLLSLSLSLLLPFFLFKVLAYLAMVLDLFHFLHIPRT